MPSIIANGLAMATPDLSFLQNIKVSEAKLDVPFTRKEAVFMTAALARAIVALTSGVGSAAGNDHDATHKAMLECQDAMLELARLVRDLVGE